MHSCFALVKLFHFYMGTIHVTHYCGCHGHHSNHLLGDCEIFLNTLYCDGILYAAQSKGFVHIWSIDFSIHWLYKIHFTLICIFYIAVAMATQSVVFLKKKQKSYKLVQIIKLMYLSYKMYRN